MTLKISNKIIILYSLLFFGLMILFVLYAHYLLVETSLNLIRQDMRDKIHFIQTRINSGGAEALRSPADLIGRFITETSALSHYRITIIDMNGRVLADTVMKNAASIENHRYRSEVKKAVNYGWGESIRYSTALSIDILYMAKKNGEMIIRLAKPLYEIKSAYGTIIQLIMACGIFLLVISVIINVIISRRITHTVSDTVAFSEYFASGDYSRRISNYSNDEFGALQRSLNRLADIIVDKIERLTLEQNKLSVIIESIDHGIVVIDQNRRVILTNPAFQRAMNVSIEPIGKLYYEVIRGSSLNEKIDNAIIQGSASSFEEKLHTGTVCLIHIMPIREGQVIQGMVIVLHDITEIKRISQIKTELVGNISHELKTPVTILKGYLETIYANLDDKALIKDLVKKAIAGSERQHALINDMLALNFIETAYIAMNDRFAIGGIISDCAAILEPKITAKKINLNVNIGPDDIVLMGNRFLAEEVFFNLLDNAINYNHDHGLVRIDAVGRNNSTAISIANTGPGIPAESIDRIFERFYRMDRGRSRSTGGTGLGLSIVRHAAELHGWRVSVISGPAETVFTVELN
jgi:two-component system phosphate regulon sensor histidine kinase PhoR